MADRAKLPPWLKLAETDAVQVAGAQLGGLHERLEQRKALSKNRAVGVEQGGHRNRMACM